jgi:NAD(P)-dependent dehydrogenase (short-subunit alcohol dehydrogenase family)
VFSHRQGNDTAFHLSGKVALVTGAGKGIGRTCALAMAAAGARVIAAARTTSDIEDLVRSSDGTVEGWSADVTDDQFLHRIEALERLDVLVNNAGVNQPQAFLDVTDDALDQLLTLNLRTAFRVARAAARVMRKTGGGSIVHMSSQMGHVGAANRSVYCMTKHGIEGLTKAMAVELAPIGIRVNAVAPTFIETPMTRPMLEEPDFARDVLNRIPLGRLGRMDEVANAVLFLASDAASMITGDSLKVDGGWTAV